MVRNPKDYFDFNVNVVDGRYLVQAEVGDIYHPTWQKVEFEGLRARICELHFTPMTSNR